MGEIEAIRCKDLAKHDKLLGHNRRLHFARFATLQEERRAPGKEKELNKGRPGRGYETTFTEAWSDEAIRSARHHSSDWVGMGSGH